MRRAFTLGAANATPKRSRASGRCRAAPAASTRGTRRRRGRAHGRLEEAAAYGRRSVSPPGPIALALARDALARPFGRIRRTRTAERDPTEAAVVLAEVALRRDRPRSTQRRSTPSRPATPVRHSHGTSSSCAETRSRAPRGTWMPRRRFARRSARIRRTRRPGRASRSSSRSAAGRGARCGISSKRCTSRIRRRRPRSSRRERSSPSRTARTPRGGRAGRGPCRRSRVDAIGPARSAAAGIPVSAWAPPRVRTFLLRGGVVAGADERKDVFRKKEE